MVQLIGIPGVQYPNNAVVNFTPLTNALNSYRQGADEAREYEISRRAGERAAAGDLSGAAAEFYRGGLPAQGLQFTQVPLQQNRLMAETEHLRAQTGLLGAQEAAARGQLAMDQWIRNWLLGNGGTPPSVGSTPAAPAASTAAPASPPNGGGLNWAVPRTDRLQPGAPTDAPAAAPGPQVMLGEGISRPAARPLATPGTPPPARPEPFIDPMSGMSMTPDALRALGSGFGGIGRGILETIVSPADAAEPARPAAPAAGRSISLPLTRSPAPAAAPAPAPTQPQPAPAAPAQPANFQSVLASMPREKQIAAMLLLAKKDYPELAKLMSESVVQEQTAAATARGKATGEAQANLPGAMQSTASMLRNIDAVIDDPYLGYVTGVQSALTGGWANPLHYLPTTPWGHDTMERINQLQGQAFLQAYQGLRGGGQITEAEGAKAQAAIGRLGNLSQSDAGYIQALNDARYEIWDLMNLARRKAGQASIPYVPHKTDTQRLQRVTSDADWDKLPSGMPYIDPEGNVKVKR